MTSAKRGKARPRVTTPALKYDVTEIYGTCEHGECDHPARLTCPTCESDVCRDHAPHDTHASS